MTLPLFSFLTLFLVSVGILGEEAKKCKDEKLVGLVEENCSLLKKLTGNAEGCKGYIEVLKNCATSSFSDEQLKNLRESVEQTNGSLKQATKSYQEMQQAHQDQLRVEFTEFKKLCKNPDLNSALDDLIKYGTNYAVAIEYLKVCRAEQKGISYSNELARQIQAGLRRIRFKEAKPPDLRPYIDQCKDADIRTASEAALAELIVLKYREIEPVVVFSGYDGLEKILFELEQNTKSENLEKLKKMRETIIAIQEVYARKKQLNSR